MLLIQDHMANMNTLLMMYYNLSGSCALDVLFNNFIFKDANLNRSLHSLNRRDIKTTKQADYFLRVSRFYERA